jgi:hypothetical protein
VVLVWFSSNVGGWYHYVGMTETAELVERMRGLQRGLAGFAGARLAGASDEELCAFTVAVEEAGRLVDAARVAAAGELADRLPVSATTRSR